MQPIKALSSYFKINKYQPVMRITCLGLLIIFLCMSCKEEHDHKGRTPLVELDGNFLYKEDVQSVLPIGLSGEDSLAFVQRYIRSWIEETLLYEKAQNNIPDDDELNRQVASYRKSLIMHTYQQALIHQKFSEEISEEELQNYFQKNQTLFKVERPFMKGLFIKVPLTAPKLANVRRWYRQENREAVEKLEKYSFQHAVKYEYFYDHWKPVAEVLDLIPLKEEGVEEYLNKQRHVELKDTAYYYFLNVSEFLSVGSQEPYDLAYKRVKDMLLNVKQVDYMQQVKDDLYQRAVERDKIKYYLE